MAQPPILLLQDIHLTLGSQALLDGAALSVGMGELLCLVGRNGSGKSTLLKIAAGSIRPDGGTRFLQPNTSLRYLPQEPDLGGFKTVLDYAVSGLGPDDDPYRARSLLQQLGLSGEEQPAHLSGGEIRRAALAQTLAASPDLLLLDEPTNHLDLPAIEWLDAELRQFRGGLVLISHDRRLLESLSRAVVWLDAGITRRMERGFSHFETWRDEVLENEEREHHKLGRQIAREEDWMRYGVTARRKRNMRRVHELGALRQKFHQDRRPASTLKLATSETGLSGKLVAVAEDASLAFGDKRIVQRLDLRVLRGDRLGIIGPNGAGKTSLLRLLTGEIAPDSGRIALGASLSVVTLDQQRRQLNPTTTLADTLTGGGGDQVEVAGQKRHVIGYMKDFLFRPEQARTPVGLLSGGERGRLMLARALAQPGNLLILDEPTNDLDLETLDLLQEYLADYPGTVLLVSHDRDFLDRVVTSTLAAEGDGQWVEYAGGYSDMLTQRGAPACEQPALRTRPTQARPAHDLDSVSPQQPARRKLSFKEKHALETLPDRMATLEHDIARLQSALADPELYSRNPQSFADLSAGLEAAQAALSVAEEAWLALEILRESLE